MLAFEHLQGSVTIAPYASVNDYGEPTYGTGVAYAALVIQKTKMVRDQQGNQKLSTVQVYLDGSVTVTVKDKITLPDSTIPLILAVETFPGLQGVAETRVVYT